VVAGQGRLGYAVGGQAQNVGDNETPAAYVQQNGPVQVGGVVTEFAFGTSHTCALLADTTLRCWGRQDNSGALGYGNGNNIGDNETPQSAGPVPMGGAVLQVDGGWYHTCAVLDGGQTRCWGRGDAGRLGYGNQLHIGDDETPADAGSVPL